MVMYICVDINVHVCVGMLTAFMCVFCYLDANALEKGYKWEYPGPIYLLNLQEPCQILSLGQFTLVKNSLGHLEL